MNFVMRSILNIVCILCSVFSTISTEQKVSDACHGTYREQCTHVLVCNDHQSILISEVRFYQWHTDDGCDFQIGGPVDEHCCLHNITRCYKSMDKNGIDELRERCINTTVANKCYLDDVGFQSLYRQCSQVIGGVIVSSVWSVRYLCVQVTMASSTPSSRATSPTTSAPPTISHGGTTTAPIIGGTTEPERTGSTDSGALVGGIVGAFIGVGLVICVFYLIRTKVCDKKDTHISAEMDGVHEYVNMNMTEYPRRRNEDTRDGDVAAPHLYSNDTADDDNYLHIIAPIPESGHEYMNSQVGRNSEERSNNYDMYERVTACNNSERYSADLNYEALNV